mmetsp:Transcript_28896/g.79317  ORF Transcript_28896/g.79317 Transcript_28896/m.79317 type:complete len:398 (+) Transcript_28896:121-1314(+)
MYSDLFDQLGGGAAGAGRRGGGGDTARAPQTPPLVSCKAGKMIVESGEGEEDATTKYQCKPDTTRGEIRLVYDKDTSMLQFQWYDRRDQKVVDRHMIPTSTKMDAGTFERVPLSGKKHARDRIYVWTHYEEDNLKTPKYDMYWMQDESEEKEDETVAKINQYLADPASAVPKDASPPVAAAASSSGSDTAPASGGTQSQSQVDALSTILENLGMPQSEGGATSSTDAPVSADSSAAPAAGTLTLADLQGAMAGMQQQQQSSTVVPLSEVVTPAAIEALLERDDICQRLMELLPENQRTKEQLADNLKSPQVQQTLRTLTQALLPDDAGNMDGFYSVLANFNLPAPTDGAGTAAAMANPIQAFLEAVLKSVEEDKKQDDEKEEGKDEDKMDEDEKQEG